jgi:hypothetical protein
MDISSCDCSVLSGRSFCDELITCPEEFYRLWCFAVCDLETSWMRGAWPTGVGDCCAKKKILCCELSMAACMLIMCRVIWQGTTIIPPLYLKLVRTVDELKILVLTCICLRRRLFRVTLEISLTAPWYRDVTTGTLTATDTCIGYHVTRFEASRSFNIGTRYVCTCVGAGSGMGGGRRKTHVLLLCISVIFLTCDMYKSSLRHIHDPVLSSLKMKGILSFYFTVLNFIINGAIKGLTSMFYGVHSPSCAHPTVWAAQRTWTFYYLCEWLPTRE